MAKSNIKAAIKFLAERLKESGIKDTKIILFGSQLARRTTEESDIDIVIISNAFRRKNIFERALLTKGAEILTVKKFMLPLDIITVTPREWEASNSLIIQMAKKGMVIYG